MSACIEWTGSRDVYGYGRFKKNGKTYKAHRVAYEQANCVSLVPAQHVCHKCDNPPCLNPEHLFLGDSAANAADRHRKGRDAKGLCHGMTKLSDEDVQRIRDICRVGGITFKEVAKYFGVSDNHISWILSGKRRSGV